jgi:hypothetical protein
MAAPALARGWEIVLHGKLLRRFGGGDEVE